METLAKEKESDSWAGAIVRKFNHQSSILKYIFPSPTPEPPGPTLEPPGPTLDLEVGPRYWH